MDLRRRLLPTDDRVVELAQSALDRSWMDRVDGSRGVFITTEGLLMYFEPDDALGLIRDCAARFPCGRAAHDIAWPPGDRWQRLATSRALDSIGPLRRIRPSITLLEFG